MKSQSVNVLKTCILYSCFSYIHNIHILCLKDLSMLLSVQFVQFHCFIIFYIFLKSILESMKFRVVFSLGL